MSRTNTKRTTLRSSISARGELHKKGALYLSKLLPTRKSKILVVLLLLVGVVSTYQGVRIFADTTSGIHIAGNATNLTTNTEGPRVVSDSTSGKQNISIVYVASAGGNPNQVSVTQPLITGTYDVCVIGRPTVTPAAGKIRVSDQPYGTASSLTVEKAFATVPTSAYAQLACARITLNNDTTVYISEVVTEGSYNFSLNLYTLKDTPTSYPTAATTGVPASATLTASSRTWFDTPGEVVDGLDLGCIEVYASNVTIRNSRITCNIPQGSSAASLDSTHWSNAFSNLTVENVTIQGTHARAMTLMPNSTVRNVKIIGQGRGIELGHGARIENSYVSLDNSNADCNQAFGGGHASALGFFSAHDVTVKNNHLEMKAVNYPADPCISGVVAIYPENQFGGPSYNVVLDGNRIVLPTNDTHYHISLSYTPAPPYNESPNHHVQVLNNRFEGRSSHGLLWNSYPQAGDVLSNNKWCPNPFGSTNGNTGCVAVTASTL